MTQESTTNPGLALLLDAIGDPNGPARVHDAWANGQIQTPDLRDNLLMLWTRIDTPALRLPTPNWVELFEASGYICLPINLRPLTYPLTVFRSATPKYVRGLAWTRCRTVAEWHQQRSAGRADIYRTFITDEATVLAHTHTPNRPEHEVIVNPVRLGVIERA